MLDIGNFGRHGGRFRVFLSLGDCSFEVRKSHKIEWNSLVWDARTTYVSHLCGKCGLPARLETLRSGDGFKQATVVPQRRRCLKKVALFLFLFDLDSVGFDIPTTSPENAQNAYSSGQGAELEGTLDKVNDHLSSLTQDIL